MGVPAAEAQAAITQRLTGAPPTGVTAEDWKHVKKLYTQFNQQLLWLTDNGVHQPRVQALLTTLAGADSDAIDLTAYPLTELNRALEAVGDKPNAQQLAEADVMLSSAFTTYGEDMLTGQLDPKTLGQAWHINPMEDKVDSALSLLRLPADSYNILYPNWELSHFPEPWIGALDRFDEVWCPSRFIFDSIDGHTRATTRHLPVAVIAQSAVADLDEQQHIGRQRMRVAIEVVACRQ